MRLRASLAALFAVAFAAPAARAGVEDTFGLGAKAMALGGSYAARPGDFAASYYNPAGLAPGYEADREGGFFELHLGYLYAHPSLHVTRANGSEIATPGTPDTSGAVLGSRFSVGQPFGLEGLNMGIALYMPSHLFRWSIYPDDDVQWGLLTDRTQVVTANFALAYRVTRWLSLGAGLRLLFDVQTLTKGRVTGVALEQDPKTGQSEVRTHTELGTDAQVFGRVAPLAGILLTPVDRLRIGLTYRHKSYIDDWGYTRIKDVPLLGNMGYSHHFAHYFEPTQVTLAVSGDLSDTVDVSADLTWAKWSEALSTNRNFWGDGSWGDTWTPAFGARWKATPALALLGGYRFQKSPLGNFGGPSNLIDNDRHLISMGLELDLGKLLRSPSIDARVNWGLQHVILVDRTETKDFRRFADDDAWRANPGYPSYSFGGRLLATSLGVEARW